MDGKQQGEESSNRSSLGLAQPVSYQGFWRRFLPDRPDYSSGAGLVETMALNDCSRVAKRLSKVRGRVGFGFHPTDVELISHYLKKKILGQKIDFEIIPEVDIYKHEPWDLPGNYTASYYYVLIKGFSKQNFTAKCRIPTRDSKWHFFTSRDRKYPNGSRSNRATEAGYWKSTGKDRNVKLHNRVIGTKKTLVFHKGRPPCGKRTDWIMHEYYIAENECKAAPGRKDIFVLCRVTKRNGLSLEGETTQTEEVSDVQGQPEDVVGSVPCEESSSPSNNVEDIEAWLLELYDPDFSGIHSIDALNNEAEGDPASLLSKQGPVESCLQPAGADDQDYLLPDDISSILQSGSDNYNLDMFGGPNFGSMDVASVLPHNAVMASNELSPAVSNFVYEGVKREDENIDTGIQIRQRHARPPTEISNHSIKLQIYKMESRNPGLVNQTIKLVKEDRHLDMNDGDIKHLSDAESSTISDSEGNRSDLSCQTASKPLQKRSADPVRPKKIPGGLVDKFCCTQGVIRGLSRLLCGCSSAGLNCLFFGACMVGTAALILYFLLRDARRFLASYNSLGL
ncbi:NAC domain-containing protein 74 [Cocos nucifera]|uniref:NAC domain-containing protein 74 n=1 Tax=Cocos nucifera TaxID=13894 RepID=A0A8K0N1Z8_COCNU|nr:NAC domain-containing protein 74 [Cocos nucifera]